MGGRILIFFSSRRRHTRYWRDWSSDVCSSDLRVYRANKGWQHVPLERGRVERLGRFVCRLYDDRSPPGGDADARIDRKSVVQGKRVDLGGRRIIKKNKHPAARSLPARLVLFSY